MCPGDQSPLGFICLMFNNVWSVMPTLSSLVLILSTSADSYQTHLWNIQDRKQQDRMCGHSTHNVCFCIVPCDSVVWMCVGDVWDWSNVCGLFQLGVDSVSVSIDDVDLLPCLLCSRSLLGAAKSAAGYPTRAKPHSPKLHH